MNNIPGYNLLELVLDQQTEKLFRAEAIATGKKVLIKIATSPDPALAQAFFSSELAIAGRLDLKGISSPLALLAIDGHPALVMKDCGGIPLQRYLDPRPLSLELFFIIARQLAAIVGSLHRHNIAHQKLNSATVLIDPATLAVAVTDFSAATPLCSAGPAQAPRLPANSPPYMSPEQTGRLDRTVDYRTDFYSLGVIFFELLAGRRPFTDTEFAHLVHAHLAKKPPSPHRINRSVPPPLAAMVLKLLAKDPAERYQSARALLLDLNWCHRQWRRKGNIIKLSLARKDISAVFQLPRGLWGRETELGLLRHCYSAARNGKAGVVLVSGFAGCGKTALVEQFMATQAGQAKGCFISGKADQLHRNRPYQVFIKAFSELLQQILSEDKKSLARWRHLLLQGLGSGGAVLSPILPEINLLTGPLPPLENLPPVEAKNRFLLAMQNFVRVFSRYGRPLVIFLDDLQWADEASLELIRYLALSPEERGLLLIGAYRENELYRNPALAAAIDELRQNGALLQEIRLAELDRAQCGQFLAAALHTGCARVEPLAAALHRKTGGNPFFLRQLLQTLYHHQVLSFNLHRWRWDWDLEAVLQLPYADEILDFLAEKFKSLPPATLATLKLAACSGDHFSPDLLAAAGDYPLHRVKEHLRQASRENLVVLNEDGSGSFLHDRVRQAAYNIIPVAEKKKLHLRLGRALAASSTPEQLEARVMEIAHHLNRGVKGLASPKERLQLAHYNLLAGRKAKASAAYRSAWRYLRAGLALLADHSWDNQYALYLAFYTETAQCEYMCGNHDRAQQMLDTALARAKTTLEKADLYLLKTILYTGLGRHREAADTGLAGLKELGIMIPLEPKKSSVLKAFLGCWWRLRGREAGGAALYPEPEDLRHLKGLNLLLALIASSYHLSPYLFASLVLKMVELSLKYPTEKYTPVAAGSFALVAANIVGVNKKIYRLGKEAVNLLETSRYPAVRGRYIFAFNTFFNHWVVYKKEGLRYFDKVFKDALATGDLFYAGYALSGAVEIKYYCGYPLSEVVADCRRHLEWLRLHKLEGTPVLFLTAFKHLALSLQGEAPAPDFGAAVSREIGTIPFTTARSYYISAIQYHYLMGNYREGLRIAALIAAEIENIAGEISYSEHHFYHALCITAIWPGLHPLERRRSGRILRKYRARFRKWSRVGPQNFEHRRLILEAECARLWGRPFKALQLYEEAIRAAAENGYPQDQALANLLTSSFYRERDMNNIAASFLEEACRGFTAWGATVVVQQLRQRHAAPGIDRPPESKSAAAEAAAAVESHRRAEVSQPSLHLTAPELEYAASLDLAALLKTTHSLAEESDWQQLALRLMQILCENAGAQSGALIMTRGGELYLEVAVKIADGEFVTLPPTPLSAQSSIPQAIVQYVSRTGEAQVLANACATGPFTRDLEITAKKMRSVCCLSVRSRDNRDAILYLENNLIDGAFTADRLKILHLFAAQVAFVTALPRLAAKEKGGGTARSKMLPETLTPREMEVLNLMASGLANQEIAEQLGLTLSTVKSHIQNIYGKLGVNRRLRAVSQARKMELLQ